MNCTRSIAPLAVAGFLLMTAGGGRAIAGPPEPTSVGTITGVSEPMTRQVVQRRDNNVGSILFIGTYSGNVDGFQASSTLQPEMNGTPLGWTLLIDVTIFEGHFLGLFRQPAGGFYDLKIRPVFRGQAGPPVSVSTVGVGEVFITAGQSNSTNWALPTGFAPNPFVSCFNPGPGLGLNPAFPGASWRWGVDPQPALDQSAGSSAWPTMASNLALALGVPVGLYSSGYTGTKIEQWLPGAVLPATSVSPQLVLFDHLTNAIRYLSERGGVRAVLWDQGESNYGAQTNPAAYEANLRFVIDESRAVTGVPVKWMVARAAYPFDAPTFNIPAERLGLEQAQLDVVDYGLTFPGPNTDSLGVNFRYSSPIGPLHFNATGIVLLGGYWGIYVANLPGFLNPGYLPPP